jgi:RNA polymerase sigma-70 factor (ECF subfamily)
MTSSAAALSLADVPDRHSPSTAFSGSSSAQSNMETVEDLARLDGQMALLADGDRSTIEPLFRALWPVVHSYCQRALGRCADADDAAQQAMVKVFAEAGRYDRTRRALPWVIAIAVWECRSVRRRRQRARTISLDAAEEAHSPAISPEEVVIERDLLDGALAAFEQLSASDRDVLRLAFEQEIEAPLSVSGATLRKRRQRALFRLRDAWRKLYGR